jgi:hypothetical protein
VAKGPDHLTPLLSTTDALARLEQILPMVRQNVKIAMALEGVLSAGNDEIRPLRGDVERGPFWDGAHGYVTIRDSIASSLALSLARLFDFGLKHRHPDERDVASLPLLVRLMNQEGCRLELISKARDWPLDDSIQVERAILSAVDEIEALQTSPKTRSALEALKEFRDFKLAHTLNKRMSTDGPRFNDLTFLLESSMRIASLANFAVAGNGSDMSDTLEERRRQGRAFWGPAIAGLIEAERVGSNNSTRSAPSG